MEAQFESQVQNEVWQTVKKLNEAWTKGNPEKLVDFFHENMLAITPSDRERIEGRGACVAAWTAFARSTKIRYFNETKPKVQVYGDAAVVTYYYDMSFDQAGQTIQAKGRDMFVMVRQNGKWWAVANQFSPFPK